MGLLVLVMTAIFEIVVTEKREFSRDALYLECVQQSLLAPIVI